MKLLFITLAVLVLTLVCIVVQAQRSPGPKWISDKGFWVVEKNIRNDRSCTIHFYNNDKQEIYKEEVAGTRLNLRKRKTLMHLKSVLETAVVAWQQQQPLDQNRKLFAAIEKR